MSILIPGTSHQITWAVQIVQDTTTYYVRAVIRDTRSNTIIATLNLDNLGNGRFSKSWNVPQDGSGFGREIEIEKTVYDDAGYTTANGQYGRFLDQYTIFNLGTRNSSTGGYGGGQSVDYKEIEKIIKKNLDSMVETTGNVIKAEKPEPVDMIPMINALHDVLKGLSGLSARISAMEMKDDDTHGEFDGIIQDVMAIKDELKATIDGSHRFLIETIDSKIEEVNSTIKEMERAEKSEIADIENKMDKQIKSLLKQFESVIEDGGKKLHSHVADAMTKPLHVSLAANVVPQKEPTPMDKRQEHIKRLIS